MSGAVLTFLSGAIIGAGLVGAYFESTISRQNRLLDSTVEQVAVSRVLGGKCQAALDTVWAKIDAGRAEEARRSAADEAGGD